MNTKTVIHNENTGTGTLHVEYDTKYPSVVYLHMGCGGFSHCVSLTALDSRQMSEALMKAAFAIEAEVPAYEERPA
jgi:hypothetical protein